MYLKYGYSFHFAKKFGNTVHTSKRINYLVLLTVAVHSDKQPGAGGAPERI